MCLACEMKNIIIIMFVYKADNACPNRPGFTQEVTIIIIIMDQVSFRVPTGAPCVQYKSLVPYCNATILYNY